MQAEDYYRQVAEEIESGTQDRAIWAWALAESGGDADKTKSLYIRRRIAAVTAAAQPAAVPPDSELQRLRGELRRQLALQQKSSFYAVLGVPADSSDAAIGEAIGRIIAGGAPLDPELRYAVETLGDAAARERFDRRLLDQLRNRNAPATFTLPAQQAASGWYAGGGLKAMAGVALVLGLGYLGLGYSRDMSEREMRLKEADLRREEIHRKAEIAARVVENQKAAIEASTAAQERAAEARERAQLEARMRDDKYRLDQAYRQDQQLAQAEQRRQQAEQARLQAEARRRDAEAAAAARTFRQQAIQDAMARGNHNEAQRLRNLPY